MIGDLNAAEMRDGEMGAMADEIEELRARVAELEAALNQADDDRTRLRQFVDEAWLQTQDITLTDAGRLIEAEATLGLAIAWIEERAEMAFRAALTAARPDGAASATADDR